MAKKKKRATKHKGGAQRHGTGMEVFLEEAREEMVALDAIFGADFAAHDDGRGFDLRVVPHPGEAESNFVSAALKLRSFT
jgi:translation initiation factor 2-alpha kinase 4